MQSYLNRMDPNMPKLTTRARKALPNRDFALPGRKYPIEDKAHAENALARVAQNGSAAQQAEVKAEVHKRYPSMDSPSPQAETRSHKTKPEFKTRRQPSRPPNMPSRSPKAQGASMSGIERVMQAQAEKLHPTPS